MKLNFIAVGVFTNRPFGGNPLAVVPDARGMTPDARQPIAAEFNRFDATFVLPPHDLANTAAGALFL